MAQSAFRATGKVLLLGELCTTLALSAVLSVDLLVTGEHLGRDRTFFIIFTYCVSTVIGIPLQTYALWASEKLHEDDGRGPRQRPPLGTYAITSLLPVPFHGAGLLIATYGGGLWHVAAYVVTWTTLFITGWVRFFRGDRESH